MSLHPGAAPLALVIAIALTAAGCGGGDTPTPVTTVPNRVGGIGLNGPTTAIPATTPPATQPVAGSATIDSFTLAAPDACTPGAAADGETSSLATYRTTGAARVTFVVDNRQVSGTAPLSGTFPVPVPCDGTIHTVILAAIDAQGASTVTARTTSDEPTAG